MNIEDLNDLVFFKFKNLESICECLSKLDMIDNSIKMKNVK